MIRVSGLTKYFGAFKALDNVTFTVNKGEILGFLGPNGAGKTTAMRLITGFYPVTEGKITVGDIDVAENPLATKMKIGYLPEGNPLYQEMYVKQFLEFVANIKDVHKKNKKDDICRCIKNCGLEGNENSVIKHLSKGFKQRVGLAQALIGDPEVLVLDEPTLGLDPAQVIEIRNLIKAMSGKKTIILSTHILPEVSLVCSRVVVIYQGKIVAEGTPEDLSPEKVDKKYINVKVQGDKESIVKKISNLVGVEKVTIESEDKASNSLNLQLITDKSEDILNRVAKEIISNGWTLLTISPQSVSLEDVFVKLITTEKGVE